MLYVALTMTQQLQRMFFRAKKNCRTLTFSRKYSHLTLQETVYETWVVSFKFNVGNSWTRATSMSKATKTTDSKFTLYGLYRDPVNLPAENVVSCLPQGCPAPGKFREVQGSSGKFNCQTSQCSDCSLSCPRCLSKTYKSNL